MNTKLELYYEDIDSIFEICKEKFNYNNFTVTSRRKFDGTLLKCNEISKKLIEQVWTDTELAVCRLHEIQMKMEKIILELKIVDEQYKNEIYKLATGEEVIDSLSICNYKDSEWKSIITVN